MLQRDPGARRHAPRGAADDARGDRADPAAGAARLPARRGRAPAGHRAVTRAGPAAGSVPASGPAVVIGAGLIGTSVALALRARGARVWLADADPAAARLAAHIGAGELLPAGGPPGGPADVAVLAVPPAAVAAGAGRGPGPRPGPLLHRRGQRQGAAAAPGPRPGLRPGLLRARPSRCPGRERSGPAAARADLFLGRPWVLCPDDRTDLGGRLAAATGLAAACGAQPVVADRRRARPLGRAGLARPAPGRRRHGRPAGAGAPHGALALAGQGLRDVTRIAAGDAGLWTQILTANAGPAADRSSQVGRGPGRPPRPRWRGIAGGRRGRGQGADRAAGARRGPGWPRSPASAAARPPTTPSSRSSSPTGPASWPGCSRRRARPGINIEDVGIEHSPGLPAGVAELAVAAGGRRAAHQRAWRPAGGPCAGNIAIVTILSPAVRRQALSETAAGDRAAAPGRTGPPAW